MKRLIIAVALGVFLMGYNKTQAQVSVNANINIGTPGPDDGFYYGGTYDYPEDYYSEYPDDYYPDPYYQDNYRDYTNSIAGINWNNLFVEFHLSSAQINAILVLNRRFPTFAAWNAFYRVNPMRWYYDRFYTLRRILSPAQYSLFYNRYYHGVMPVVYFTNYRRTYYTPRFRPMPRYRSMAVTTFRRPAWGAASHRNYGQMAHNGTRNNFKGVRNYGQNRPNVNNRGNNRGYRPNPGNNRNNNVGNRGQSNSRPNGAWTNREKPGEGHNNRGNWNNSRETGKNFNNGKHEGWVKRDSGRSFNRNYRANRSKEFAKREH